MTVPHKVAGRCAVLHPVFTHLSAAKRTLRTPEAKLEEINGLALAINLDVAMAEIVPIRTPKPATLFGRGTVERIAQSIADHHIEIVVIDATVTPIQQRNLEKAWSAKVIDRTGLILEIFGARAHTREGQMQVELAALTYQRSRLVRSWTHLERQRGGFGFLGGPGESQLEIDRRLIDERIVTLKKDLSAVARTRGLHRQARTRVPYPIVAFVGYTNAGKSTLFNRLTGSEVLAKDMLFATLDPTMRQIRLPSGRFVILSDTVGFISDLPHQLIAAFRATLEEVREADVLVHVRDMADPFSAAQRQDVMDVLDEVMDNPEKSISLIEAQNKIDLLAPAQQDALGTIASRDKSIVPVSALTGQGCDTLLKALDTILDKGRAIVTLALSTTDGSALAWLYKHSQVLNRQNHDDQEILLTVGIAPEDLSRFLARYPTVREIDRGT
ncbi:MAG: GTPase HflX [Alphaproteobacteria bacterium]